MPPGGNNSIKAAVMNIRRLRQNSSKAHPARCESFQIHPPDPSHLQESGSVFSQKQEHPCQRPAHNFTLTGAEKTPS
jgi:hypothetical protein